MLADTLLKKYVFLNEVPNQITQNIDFSKSTISDTVEKSYQAKYNSKENEELSEYIFKFYAYNEILSSMRTKNNGIISKEDLTIFSEHEKFINDFSKRIFSFILYACIAEARHADEIGGGNDHYGEKEYEYNKALIKAYADETIEKYKNGTEAKLLTSCLKKLEDYHTIKAIDKIKNNEKKLKSLLIEYIEDWSLVYEIPKSFDKEFKKTYQKEEVINKEALRIFKQEFVKNKKEGIDKEKLSRFNDFWNFLIEVSNSKHDGDAGDIQRELIKKKTIQNSKISDFTIEESFEYLSAIFLNGFDHDRDYGNEPWSNIAKHGLAFARGEINAEIFIDQALSLEHNNGQMFNKEFIFENNVEKTYLAYLTHSNYVNGNTFIRQDGEHFDVKSLMLHLQNSSSVLSLSSIMDKDWKALTKNLNKETLEKIHPDLKQKEIDVFKTNFNNLNKIIKQVKFLPEMLALAKKMEYSIPNFNFENMMLVAIDKERPKSTLSLLEKSIDINKVFSDIVNGKFSDINKTKKITYPQKFKYHNLIDNASKELPKELIGGKAKGLTELISKGFNVPKAIVFDTETCLSYLSNSKFFNQEYKKINNEISAYLTDKENNPLLVSVRSGAPVSMPGMMDSILNVGIDDTTYPKLCEIYGKKMINECVISFINQFCSSRLGLDVKLPSNFDKALDKFAEILIKNDIPCNRKNTFPLNKEEQIKLSVEAVFNSWNSPRAIAWRNEKNISHEMGTTATIQQMVFGNKNENSLTSVVFSRDCINGNPEIMGEYLVKAQGEDLVSGKRTPESIQELKIKNPEVYKQIEYIAKVLEVEKKAIQDLEITVEDNKVYLLQMRNAVVSPDAQLMLAKELDLNLLEIVQHKNLVGDMKIDTQIQPEFSGLAASPGLISGIIVKNEKDINTYKSSGKNLIFFSSQALPEHAPIMIATDAFITEFGGATSHAAILARSMEKPCVVGIGKKEINSGEIVTIDAINGNIWKGELPIIINQEKAIDLSEKLLKENNIKITKTLPKSNFSINSWTTELSNFNILEKVKSTKNNMFLNIAQQTAIALKMEHTKKSKSLSI